MGFRVGFHKTLLKIGKWRFGLGYSTRGTTGFIMLCIYGIMNLMWYMVLGCLWITYGFIWLLFILPAKLIIKIGKNKKNSNQQQNQQNSQV